MRIEKEYAARGRGLANFGLRAILESLEMDHRGAERASVRSAWRLGYGPAHAQGALRFADLLSPFGVDGGEFAPRVR